MAQGSLTAPSFRRGGDCAAPWSALILWTCQETHQSSACQFPPRTKGLDNNGGSCHCHSCLEVSRREAPEEPLGEAKPSLSWCEGEAGTTSYAGQMRMCWSLISRHSGLVCGGVLPGFYLLRRSRDPGPGRPTCYDCPLFPVAGRLKRLRLPSVLLCLSS